MSHMICNNAISAEKCLYSEASGRTQQPYTELEAFPDNFLWERPDSCMPPAENPITDNGMPKEIGKDFRLWCSFGFRDGDFCDWSSTKQSRAHRNEISFYSLVLRNDTEQSASVAFKDEEGMR
ncbi:hypothetical protein CDAR_431191 [Caerostris darwini]|uniref:MAM domain-containing protein n=1 Tax=Caerostris darwini TaxID=1538125 RepID=A0AAV4RTV2_9ARAC|nr:hypothetical protein CDAR_431191 [Caerostris darwini]